MKKHLSKSLTLLLFICLVSAFIIAVPAMAADPLPDNYYRPITVKWDGKGIDKTFSVEELQGLEHIGPLEYSSNNSVGTFTAENNVIGVPIAAILEAAGINLSDLAPNQRIALTPGDNPTGTMNYIWENLSEPRYVFDNSTGNNLGTVPAVLSVNNISRDRDRQRLVFGQTYHRENNRTLFCGYVIGITIGGEVAPWSVPQPRVNKSYGGYGTGAAPDPIVVPGQQFYILPPASGTAFYTTDGSEPNTTSAKFIDNANAEISGGNQPLTVPADDGTGRFIVKAKTIAIGGAASETATYTYYYESENPKPIELSKTVGVMQTLGKSPAPIRPADFSVEDFICTDIISVDASGVSSAGIYWSKELPNSASQDYIVVTGYKSTDEAVEDFTVVVADASGNERTAVVSLKVTPFTDGGTMLLTISDNVSGKSYEFSKTELHELWLEAGDVYTYTSLASPTASTQEPFIHTMGLTFDALINGFEKKIQDRDNDPTYSVERTDTRVGVRTYDSTNYSQFTWEALDTLLKAYPDSIEANGIDVPYVIALTTVSLRGGVDDVHLGRMMRGQTQYTEKANSTWLKYVAAWNGTRHGEIAINNISPAYSISLTPDTDKDFGSATFGYGEQTAYSVTVNNNGNQATGALDIVLSGDDAVSFKLSKASIANIGAGGSGSFTIVPQTGLAVGTYKATVTVNGANNLSESFDVSFTVQAGSPPELTVLPATIVQDHLSYIHVQYSGAALQDADFSLVDENGENIGNGVKGANGKAVITVTAPSNPGTYKVVAQLEGTKLAESTIGVVSYNPDIWQAYTGINEDGYVVIYFNENITDKVYSVTVNGVAGTGKVENGNTIVTEVEASSLPDGETTFSVSGVKYPRLYPSYTFTFTAAYTK